MEEFIAFIAPYADLLKMLGIIVGSIMAMLVFSKKIIFNLLDEKFEVINDKVDELSEQVSENLEEIKKTNLDQMQKINQLLKFQEELSFTDQHILRALITGKYYEYSEKNYLPLYERECLSLLYRDYKILHGNSFVDSLYEELMCLPYEKNVE